MSENRFDAIVVGSGPNGLAAAITLQQAGLSVLLVEGKDTIGGGTRTEELTLPGFKHDVCSAIHPMAIHSPFLASLPLEQYGLEYIHAPVAAAHPFDNGHAAFVTTSLTETAAALGIDKNAYYNLIHPIVAQWDQIIDDILAPLRFPAHPLQMAAFGIHALQPASRIVTGFKTREARGLWAGMAAHSIQPLQRIITSAIGLVLMAAAHRKGWPLPKGGLNPLPMPWLLIFYHWEVK
ncbi:phytoene desaturase family protein [Niabella ginsenosidivorans]|uniref:phytoene desaturase family protein n=1 Tax=Niabella ginsenosidivorans TaxID=1176587 RepID=UPI000A56EEDD|nr:NAD(P)/FAD-dependent oxidoreductase [Niabella ginsenosidivorans]